MQKPKERQRKREIDAGNKKSEIQMRIENGAIA